MSGDLRDGAWYAEETSLDYGEPSGDWYVHNGAGAAEPWAAQAASRDDARSIAAAHNALLDERDALAAKVERVEAECEQAEDHGSKDECDDAWVEVAVIRAALRDQP